VPQCAAIFTAAVEIESELAEAERQSALVQYERTIQTGVYGSLQRADRAPESEESREHRMLVNCVKDRTGWCLCAVSRWCGYAVECA